MTAFEEMGVMPEIGKAVEEMDWILPTDVQAEAIPLILGGGDVLMAAETGSGKTGAFCLPVLQIVWETLRDIAEGRGSSTASTPSSVKWGLSLYDRGSSFVVTPDGLRCQSREFKEWHGARATKGVFGGGKHYYEARVADEGLCRLGWATSQANLNLGTDRGGWGFGGTGKKSNGGNFDDYGGAFGKADVIGACLDLDDREIRFTKNGKDLGCAFKIPPSLSESVFYPAVVLKNAEMEFNFGGEPFKFPPPDGYTAISSAKNVQSNPMASGSGQVKPKVSSNAPYALILEPSRELANQTRSEITKFKKYLNAPKVRELLLVGGESTKDQQRALEQGVDIVVGTAGRVEELISSGSLDLSRIRFFILDEADGLLKQGVGPLIDNIHSRIPKVAEDGRRLQMVVCSATLHDFAVKKLAEKMMHFPTWVDLKGEDAVPETVHHVVLPIDPRSDTTWHSGSHVKTDGVHAKDPVRPGGSDPETLSEGVKILKGFYTLRAIDALKMDRGILFCRTKVDCDHLEEYLNKGGGGALNTKNPYSCVCLHGDRPPKERTANLGRFREGKVKFLICTDVAARGIDIQGIPFMVNVTMPDDNANYLHRIGRVGRADRMGLAISLVSSVPEKVWYHGCPSRGKSCWNTRLTTEGGCCIWYNEKQILGEIEDHLNITIGQIGNNFDIPVEEFDGRVTYGGKRAELAGVVGAYHLDETASILSQLSHLETLAQDCFLSRHYAKDLI